MRHRRAATTTKHLFIAALTGLALVACSGDGENGDDDGQDGVTPPPDAAEQGTVQGFATDDPSSGSGTYTGTLSGRGDLEISKDNNTWYTLGTPMSFTVDLQDGSSSAALTAAIDVPTGVYKYVRVNFDDVDGVVEAGSTVEGETLTSDVNFRLGDTQNAVISLEVPGHDLTEGSSVDVMVDFNSEDWMTVENLSNRQVPKSQFEHAARATFVTGG